MRKRVQAAAMMMCAAVALAVVPGAVCPEQFAVEAFAASAEDFYGWWDSTEMDFTIHINGDGTYECYDSEDGFLYDGSYYMANGKLYTDDEVSYTLSGDGKMRDNLGDVLRPISGSDYSSLSDSSTSSSYYDDDSIPFFKGLAGLQFRYGSEEYYGWYTAMYVESDGSFSGYYSEDHLDNVNSDHPGGVRYWQSFGGEFSYPEKMNDYVYRVEITSFYNNFEPGSSEMENSTLYIYTEPYGLINGNYFYFYLPGTPISELPEDYLSWVSTTDYDDNGELACYGFYNEATGKGFSSFFANEY